MNTLAQNEPLTNSPQPVCPFIGLASDSGSLLAYPAKENLCHNCHPALIPAFDHQEKYCLTSQHESCPAFQSGILPLDARHKIEPSQKKSNKKLQITWVALIALLATGLIFGAWTLFNEQSNKSTELPAPSVQVTINPTPTVIPTEAPTLQPQATETALNTPQEATATTEVTPTTESSQTDILRRLYVPVGPPERQFVIHRILDGDNFDILLRRYGTTLEAVQAINFRVPLPVWVDLVLVFPYNSSDVSGLPILQGIEVTQESISIDELASTLNLDASILKSLNNCPNGCTLQKGDWILAPRQP